MNFVSVDSGNVWHVTSAQKIFVDELTKHTQVYMGNSNQSLPSIYKYFQGY